MSVGSLYQYFPNRQALLAAVVERHLDELVDLIEADCRKLRGAKLAALARGLVDAFIAAKWNRHEVTRAMHEPLADVGGGALIEASALRGNRHRRRPACGPRSEIQRCLTDLWALPPR